MFDFRWESIAWYGVFANLAFYTKLWVKNFNGDSEAIRLFISVFALASTIVGIWYLVTYGLKISWVSAAIVFLIGMGATFFGVFIERLTGWFTLSLISIIFCPVAAYMMLATLK